MKGASDRAFRIFGVTAMIDVMKRVSLTLLLVVGCSDRSCEREDVLAQYVGGESQLDCGGLYDPSDSNLDAWRESHRCVRQALETRAPFVVRWSALRPESRSELALVGGASGTAFNTAILSSANGKTRTHECAELRDLGDCSDLTLDLCFECVDPILVDRCPD